MLGCPDGGGQLALDWIVDVLADDGMLDGQTVAATGPAGAIEAARGALGTDGCRAATVAGGGPSLDALVEASIAAGPFPSGAARTDLEAGRLALFTHVFLTSLLEPAGPGRFQHELLTAESDDVADSARPVISAEAAYTVENGNVTLAAHGFTARLGSALGDELRVDRLTAVGLGGDADTLGQALVGSARASGGLTGCAAIDAVVCAPAGLAPGCVTAACPAAGTALDGALTAWWRYLDGTGLDLTLVGHAGASDSDGDLVLDLPGTGRWDVALTLASGEQVETAGTWLVEVPIGP